MHYEGSDEVETVHNVRNIAFPSTKFILNFIKLPECDCAAEQNKFCFSTGSASNYSRNLLIILLSSFIESNLCQQSP